MASLQETAVLFVHEVLRSSAVHPSLRSIFFFGPVAAEPQPASVDPQCALPEWAAPPCAARWDDSVSQPHPSLTPPCRAGTNIAHSRPCCAPGCRSAPRWFVFGPAPGCFSSSCSSLVHRRAEPRQLRRAELSSSASRRVEQLARAPSVLSLRDPAARSVSALN